MLVVTGYCG